MNSKPTKIKFVKKANAWCRTSFLVDEKGNEKIKQDWFDSEREAMDAKPAKI